VQVAVVEPAALVDQVVVVPADLQERVVAVLAVLAAARESFVTDERAFRSRADGSFRAE
jgi:hypothetical protein